MNVYILTDLEGVAGVVSFEDQAFPSGKYGEAAKKLLTAEVNAAVAGLVEAGVEDVLVWDGHGGGGICFEDLRPPAKLMHGRPLAPPEARDPIISQYDVCMIIGQHAMAGTVDGNLNHTQSSATIEYITLNGRPIGEIAQFALDVGAMGLPVIFLSGDEAACREAEQLIPAITTVAVKKGLSRGSAVSLSAPEARRRIQEGVKEALAKHAGQPIPPLVWPGPYVLEKRFFHTHVADAAAAAPGAQRVDSVTVRLRGDDVRAIVYR